jgi:hypothetical protein
MLSKMLRGSVNNTTNPIPTDANFNQVSLLLHGDGTNGAQNNNFLDSSTNNFTVTRNGNTTQGTNTPFSQAAGYWSNYFNSSATSTYMTVPAFAVPSDFTIEFFYYSSSKTGYQTFYDMRGSSYLNSGLAFFAINTSSFNVQTAGTIIMTTSAPAFDKWHHVACVRSGTTMSLFIDGVRTNTITNSTSFPSNTQWIGTLATALSTYELNGYLSNLRVVNGTAVYSPSSTTLTVPTTPLTAITNTQLLTCQSNYFKDNSSNNYALTVTGTPSVQPFSPFAPTSAYSTSVNGGSMYFDGTGDYLTVATNAAFTYGVSDFTMECWVYLTTTGAIQYVIDQRNSGTANAVIPAIYVSASNVLTYFVSNAAQITGTTALTVGTWYHVAVSRSTLSTKMFLNGAQEGSTYTDANSYAASRVVIGSNAATAGNYLVGYVSNVRLVNGT